MPAIHSAASTSALVDATAQHTLMAQYHAGLALASVNFNPTARRHSRGSCGMIPYPSSEDVFLRSNHSVNEDDDFADLSLPDFIHVQDRIAHHRFRRYRNHMNSGERGLFGRRLEDMEVVSEVHDTPIEVATSFAASLGMALYQNDVEMEDRVRISCLDILLPLTSSF